MANFFIASFIENGEKKVVEGRLWLLEGLRDEEGYALLKSLRVKEEKGEITDLMVDYES